MGMSIAEPIQTLEYLRDCGVFPFSTVDGVLYTVESIDVAIETMRKYQKIESKIKVLRHFTEDTPLATQRMIRIVNEIREVLEDGNDD